MPDRWNAKKFSFVFLVLMLFCSALGTQPKGLKYSPVKTSLLLGDYYYLKKDYPLAQIEYERGLRFSPGNASRKAVLQSKLFLSLLRQEKFTALIDHDPLGKQGEFPYLYLRMFAALRSGWIALALQQQGHILASPQISLQKKEQALLLGGSIHLERGDYEETRRFYTKLQRESQSQTVRYQSGQLLSSLQRHRDRPRKSRGIAGLLAALLPGSGYIYTEHYTDGLLAFFFNAAFLGSALVLYDLEQSADRPHYASAAMGLVGVNFYLANVFGALQSANRYNNFRERRFHQEIRNSFFNVEHVEKTSGIHFQSQ